MILKARMLYHLNEAKTFDDAGKQVRQQAVRPGVNRADLIGLAAGLYHYTLLDDRRLLKMGKVVKL